MKRIIFFEQTVTFRRPTTVNITTVPFHLNQNGDHKKPTWIYRDTHPTFGYILGGMYRSHPISELRYWDCGVSVQKRMFHGWPFYRRYDMREDSHRSKVLFRVAWRRFWSGCNVKDESNEHWVGMIHPEIDTKTTTGQGYRGVEIPILKILPVPNLLVSALPDTIKLNLKIDIPKKSSWVKMRNNASKTHWYYSNEGAATLAHELGHNRGLKHVDCSGGEKNTTSNYPYPRPDCRLDEKNEGDGFFGFDVYHDVLGLNSPTIIGDEENVSGSDNYFRAYPLMGYNTPPLDFPL